MNQALETVAFTATPEPAKLNTVIAAARRLEALAGNDSPEAKQEIEYLEGLQTRICTGMDRAQIAELVARSIRPQHRARASSIFDAGTIDRRLVVLAGKPQIPEVLAEVDYLTKLRARKFPEAPANLAD